MANDARPMNIAAQTVFAWTLMAVCTTKLLLLIFGFGATWLYEATQIDRSPHTIFIFSTDFCLVSFIFALMFYYIMWRFVLMQSRLLLFFLNTTQIVCNRRRNNNKKTQRIKSTAVCLSLRVCLFPFSLFLFLWCLRFHWKYISTYAWRTRWCGCKTKLNHLLNGRQKKKCLFITFQFSIWPTHLYTAKLNTTSDCWHGTVMPDAWHGRMLLTQTPYRTNKTKNVQRMFAVRVRFFNVEFCH